MDQEHIDEDHSMVCPNCDGSMEPMPWDGVIRCQVCGYEESTDERIKEE